MGRGARGEGAEHRSHRSRARRKAGVHGREADVAAWGWVYRHRVKMDPVRARERGKAGHAVVGADGGQAMSAQARDSGVRQLAANSGDMEEEGPAARTRYEDGVVASERMRGEVGGEAGDVRSGRVGTQSSHSGGDPLIRKQASITETWDTEDGPAGGVTACIKAGWTAGHDGGGEGGGLHQGDQVTSAGGTSSKQGGAEYGMEGGRLGGSKRVEPVREDMVALARVGDLGVRHMGHNGAYRSGEHNREDLGVERGE